MRHSLTVGLISVLILLLTCSIQAQTLTGKINGQAELWPTPSECYQNQFDVNTSLTGEYKGIEITPHGRLEWWGNCNSQITIEGRYVKFSSPLNTEATHGWKRKQGLRLQYRFSSGIGIGWNIRREGIEWSWARPFHESALPKGARHDGFPHDDSWEGAERRCMALREGKDPDPSRPGVGICPRIGYEDGTGPMVSYKDSTVHMRIETQPFTWKPLTYTPNLGRWFLKVRTGNYLFQIRGKINVHRELFPKFLAYKKFGDRFLIGLTIGRHDAPDWSTPPFWNGGATVRIH